MNKVKNLTQSYLNEFKGWKSSEKIVIFESDDWGALRTTSREALMDLRNCGVKVDNCHYMTNDALETVEDLECIFGVIAEFLDAYGRHPQFTFNTVMANPDFSKIGDSNFSEYYYKPINNIYHEFGEERALTIMKSAIEEGLMYPQFHGREHVNLKRWFKDLRNKRKDTMVGFRHGMYGISGHVVSEKRGSYLAVFDEVFSDHEIEEYFIEGLMIFESIFKFHPKTFISPNYTWGSQVEEFAVKHGITCMQGIPTQTLPTLNDIKQGVVKNYLGKKSKSGIGYLIRNVEFEPSADLNKDWVDSALRQIAVAFKNKRPAIIDTHRVNYMGGLNKYNRDRGIKLLKELISKILINWPEVRFYNSEDLAERIYNQHI